MTSRMLNDKEPFILLDDCSPDGDEGHSYLFDQPEHIITADKLSEVDEALLKMDALLEEGFHLAGWISYEVAAAFESRIKASIKHKADEALIWMMASKTPSRLTQENVTDLFTSRDTKALKIVPGDEILPLSVYESNMDIIQDYIQAGDVYQINYTFDLPFHIEGSVIDLYGVLREKQKVHYGALIKTDDAQILSLSPELFIECVSGVLTARPMKGTAPLGVDKDDNKRRADAMLADEKTRAENLMIVDLLRNDLSRISEPGSVEVPALFAIEEYQTLLQMTSTITAKLSEKTKPSEILPALFPCGSVTGAPKIRAIEIISQQEMRPRGVYCGAIGHFAPGGDFTLSVPIRTATIKADGQGHLGIGSGIVADSITTVEYEECFLKARFLTEINPTFDLIETLKWTPDEGLCRLDDHLDRLERSATSFHRPVDIHMICQKLIKYTENSVNPQRVRVLLSRNGTVQMSKKDLISDISAPEQTICLAKSVMNSQDPLLRHKTSQRYIYDSCRIKAIKKHGVLDVIFTNEKGEITEGAISNIFAEIDGVLHTPPVACGLLPGIMRQNILDGTHATKETILKLADLHKASQLYICNSARGLVSVSLIDTSSKD